MGYSRKTKGLILSRQNQGEADRLISLFTERHGLIRFIAKGVRKIPSRRGGHLEPLTQIVVILTGSAHRTYAAGIETLEWYLPLRRQAGAWNIAEAITKLALRFIGEHEIYPELYRWLEYMWNTLPRLNREQQVCLEAAFSLLLLQKIGIAPALDRCHKCGLSAPKEAIVLTSAQGGWNCLSCHAGLAGTRYSLPPNLLQAIRWLAQQPSSALRLKVPSSAAEQLQQALRHYIATIEQYPMLTPPAQVGMRPLYARR